MPGPPPKKNARFGKGKSGWRTLPADGYQGPVPDWPLVTEPTAEELEVWHRVWRLPQAAMWAGKGVEATVARYCKVSVAVEMEPTAAMLGEMRHMDDRLGLSPMALNRLQWEIGDPVGEQSSSGKVIEARERFANL